MMTMGMESGKIVHNFRIKDVIKCVWGLLLSSGDYLMVIGVGSCVLVFSVATGNELHRWTTPGQVLTIVGQAYCSTGARIVVGGKWTSLWTYDIPDMSVLLNETKDEVHFQEFGLVKSGAVRSTWMSQDGKVLAFSDNAVCRIQDLQNGSDLKEFCCNAEILGIWGSKDNKVLVTGLSNSSIIVWCLSSSVELLRLACEAPIRSICGYGNIDQENLSIVAGTMMTHNGSKRSSIRVWRITGNPSKPTLHGRLFRNASKGARSPNIPENEAVDTNADMMTPGDSHPLSPDKERSASKSTAASSPVPVRPKRGGTLETLAVLEAKHKARYMVATLIHEFPTHHGINCISADPDGNWLLFGTTHGHVTMYRLDDLRQCGPSLKMFQHSHNTSQDIMRYMSSLGTTLLDGSLMQWLIVNGRVDELNTLLSVRPSAALMPLEVCMTLISICMLKVVFVGQHYWALKTLNVNGFKQCGKSALELATLMRSSKTLELLLFAAVEFALKGEPHFDALGGFIPSASKNEDRTRLLPPAMRRVTDCIRLALQSIDMTEVISRFLHQLPTYELQIPGKFLPRCITQRFQV